MVRGRTAKAWIVTLALVLLAIASAGCGESESASRGRPYADMLKRDGSKVGTALQNVGSGCKDSSLSPECVAGYKAALDEVNAFRKDLDSTPPPDCLKKYDGNIRDGLTGLSSGLEKVIQGLEAKDAATITAGGEEVKAGGDQMKASEKSAEDASC